MTDKTARATWTVLTRECPLGMSAADLWIGAVMVLRSDGNKESILVDTVPKGITQTKCGAYPYTCISDSPYI